MPRIVARNSATTTRKAQQLTLTAQLKEAMERKAEAGLPVYGLSVQQVSASTGLSVPWLNQLRCENKGPPFMRIGRRILYAPDAVQAWLAAHTQQTLAA